MAALLDILDAEMQKKAEIMCEKYCKYGEQVDKEMKTKGSNCPSFKKYCNDCPMIEFFTH